MCFPSEPGRLKILPIMMLRPQPWLLLLAAASLVLDPARAQVWRWSNPQPNGNNIVDMTWNGTLGVQVAELGQIYTSPDMQNWVPCVNKNTNNLQAVRFFGSRIVVCGQNGLVGYSDDGVNFTCTNLNFSSGNWLVGLAASGSRVVAVGDNAVIYTSTDGANWTGPQASPPGVGGNWLTGAAWHGGTFVICGEQGYIANSSDGLHWTNQDSGIIGNGNTGNMEAVVWLDGSGSKTNFPYQGFWSVTDDGRAIYSTNYGSSWQTFSSAPSTNVLYTVAGCTNTVALGGDEDIQIGRMGGNGVIWTSQTGLLPTDAPLWTYFASLWSSNAYATNGAYYLAGYYGMLIQSSNTAAGAYNWSQPYLTARDWLWQVEVVNGLYLAVGDNARIMNSDNGADWSIEDVPATNSVAGTNTVFFCVGGNTNLFLAAGNQGSVAISPNTFVTVTVTNVDGSLYTNTASTLGIIWDPLPAANVPTTNDLTGVCCFSNRFYLVGGNGTILNSVDGTNWVRLSSPTTADLASITPFTNLVVMVGDAGGIYTSPDGTNWTKRVSGTTNGLIRIRAFSNTLVAVGENGTLLTSTNAMSWSLVHLAVTNWLNDAVMVSNTCYVVGNNGVVLASTNLVAWTNVPIITTSSLYGAATQNGQLVVVGFEGSILRSQIVPDLNPVSVVDYSQSGGDNFFLVSGDVDQQFTLDSSTNLLNWTTGPLLDLYYGNGILTFYTSIPTNTPVQLYRCTVVP